MLHKAIKLKAIGDKKDNSRRALDGGRDEMVVRGLYVQGLAATSPVDFFLLAQVRIMIIRKAYGYDYRQGLRL